MEQPEGFMVKGKENLVYKLKKSLYGLKQAPWAWYCKIDTYFTNQESRSPNEPTLYVKQKGDQVLIISLYVDDLLVIRSNKEDVQNFKKNMK